MAAVTLISALSICVLLICAGIVTYNMSDNTSNNNPELKRDTTRKIVEIYTVCGYVVVAIVFILGIISIFIK